MTKQNILDYPFSKFAPECTSRGYEPTKHSGTGYFVQSKNGVRCEFHTTRGGFNSVGYGSPAPVVALIKEAIEKNEALPLKIEKILGGSVNFRFESIEKFFDLVTMIEALALPERRGRGRPKGSVIVRKDKDVPKSVKKKLNEAYGKVQKSPYGSQTQTRAIAAIDARKEAKASGATEEDANREAIKAANLVRIREATERQKAKIAQADKQRAEDEKIIDQMAPGFDMPAFLMKDHVMNGKVEKMEGGE